MIALADCNTFFASVERALHPGLKGKPVCVLSSNDGNVIALTAEAKALGIKRGAPFFQVKGILEKNNVAVFSSNIMLYSAMSKRVQSIMRNTVAHTESYSIDEQFLYLDGYEKNYDLVELMRGMVRKSHCTQIFLSASALPAPRPWRKSRASLRRTLKVIAAFA